MCWCCYMCCLLYCDTRRRRRARRAARSRRSLRSRSLNSFPDASFRNSEVPAVPKAYSVTEVPLGVGFCGTASGTNGPQCWQQGMARVLVGAPGVGGSGPCGPPGGSTYASYVHIPIEGSRTIRYVMAPAAPYGGPMQQQMQSRATGHLPPQEAGVARCNRSVLLLPFYSFDPHNP